MSQPLRGRGENPNSAQYWLDATRTVANEYSVSVPETAVVEIDPRAAVRQIDGEDALPWDEIEAVADAIGYPVFLRTDHASAKHGSGTAYRVEDADDLRGAVVATLDYNFMRDLHPTALLFRDWIDIYAPIHTEIGPDVGVEFRVFATPDRHLCTHYYWPEDAVAEKDPVLPQWRDKRDLLSEASRPPWFSAAAKAAAFEADFQNVVDDPTAAWSVDFARGGSNEWYLIDMARGDASWHPEDCPHAESGADD